MTPVGTPLQHLAIGPPTNGVVRYARALARAAARGPGPAAARDRHHRVGVHLSHSLPAADRDDVHAAADRAGGSVATFHDLDGVGARPAQAAAYAWLARRADALVAPCDEEADIAAARWPDRPVSVVPHHVDHRRAVAATAARRTLGLDGRARVGLLGHAYPGKGFEDVVDALAGHPDEVEVVLCGGASDVHAAHLVTLRARARAAGVAVRSTGWLDDDALDLWLAAVDVPVVPSQRAAASGSLATWVGAGRAPLVRHDRPAHRHARHHWDLALPSYDPPSLASAVRAALDDPSRSRLGPGPHGPGVAATLARYDAVLDSSVRSQR